MKSNSLLNLGETETGEPPEKWFKAWMTKKNIIILSAIITFIVILALLATSGINLGEVFITFTFWYGDLFGTLGIYLALFIISIFANMTVIFPVPYTIALAVIIFLQDVNPVILGISAGAGAAIGEITAYYVGKGSASLTDTSKSESIKKMKARIKKGYAIPLMFLCAATPIPDDQLLLLLGYAGYSIWKMLITYFFGKITLCLWTAFLIKFAWNVPSFEPFFAVFGIDRNAIIQYEATGHYESSINPWISFIAWLAVLILFIVIFYFDWIALFRKILKIQKKTNEKNTINAIYLQVNRLSKL
ncbi:MAG: VTT domain-containing protein [Candidatus Helarchaeota archaeon]